MRVSNAGIGLVQGFSFKIFIEDDERASANNQDQRILCTRKQVQVVVSNQCLEPS